MELIEVETYQFKELNEEAQQKALEHFRDINVDDNNWAEFITDDFINEMEAVGILINSKNLMWNIYENYADVEQGAIYLTQWINYKYPTLQNKIEPLRKAVEMFEEGNLVLNSNGISVDYSFEEDAYDDPDKDRAFSREMEWIAGEIGDYIKERSKELIKELRNAYDDMTSDEFIRDTIEANEYRFTKSGAREWSL